MYRVKKHRYSEFPGNISRRSCGFNSLGRLFSILFLTAMQLGCTPVADKKALALYDKQCASCHVLPNIESLPKDIWRNHVLPDMGARMGLRIKGYDPMDKLSFKEQNAVLKTGIYSRAPSITPEDWNLLQRYIIKNAPGKLKRNTEQKIGVDQSPLFKAKAVNLDGQKGAFITYLGHHPKELGLLAADLNGNLYHHDQSSDSTVIRTNFGQPITDISFYDDHILATKVGYLDPSQIPRGRLAFLNQDNAALDTLVLHRPVHTLAHDFNKDGIKEYVVAEFGHLTGALSLITRKDQLSTFEKKTLIAHPGAIRTQVRDLNKDGRDDILVLMSQGREGVQVLYQGNDLNFTAKELISFSPVYGSSWFELLDYDGDGDEDIITVHGDNADKSYVHKPYHGMRIHINDGQNNFEERFFYPMNGATRFVAADFDQDGDVDFGILSTFPDYDNGLPAFVYLQNENAARFKFKGFGFPESKESRWLLISASDLDGDGDKDIALGAFTYVLTPVPENAQKRWETTGTDLLILENLSVAADQK